MAEYDSRTITRFWAKVDKRGLDECWPWTAFIKPNGYGGFSIAHGRPETSHRIAWELHNGPIPKGLFVCHHCDNRSCCNPGHLFLGSHSDNMADMTKKGRHSKLPMTWGEKVNTAKLTESAVLEIRRRLSSGYPTSALARTFGVSKSAIKAIKWRKTWKHVA